MVPIVVCFWVSDMLTLHSVTAGCVLYMFVMCRSLSVLKATSAGGKRIPGTLQTLSSTRKPTSSLPKRSLATKYYGPVI